MRAAAVLVALAAALVLQTTFAGVTMASASRVDLVLVVVVYVALAYGAVTGLLAGTVGGLVQDALAGGIVGIGGLSKTVAGFLVGVLGAQFIVAQPFARFLMFIGATVVHEACYRALYALVEPRGFTMPMSRVLVEALVNGAVGILAFQLIEGTPGLMKRRQSRRSSLSRRRY